MHYYVKRPIAFYLKWIWAVYKFKYCYYCNNKIYVWLLRRFDTNFNVYVVPTQYYTFGYAMCNMFASGIYGIYFACWPMWQTIVEVMFYCLLNIIYSYQNYIHMLITIKYMHCIKRIVFSFGRWTVAFHSLL